MTNTNGFATEIVAENSGPHRSRHSPLCQEWLWKTVIITTIIELQDKRNDCATFQGIVLKLFFVPWVCPKCTVGYIHKHEDQLQTVPGELVWYQTWKSLHQPYGNILSCCEYHKRNIDKDFWKVVGAGDVVEQNTTGNEIFGCIFCFSGVLWRFWFSFIFSKPR